MAGAALFLSLLANFYQVSHPRNGVVVESKTDAAHTLVPLMTISSPINTIPIVENWVKRSLVHAFTIDFSMYQKQMDASKSDFTPSGWLGFQNAINDSFLPTVISGKYTVSAVVSGPVVFPHDPVPHATSWTMQVPMILTFSIGTQSVSQHALVEVTVVRQPASRSLLGRGIDSIKFI